MPEAAFTVRRMRPAELDLAIDWAAAEGWNPGLADAEAFRAADPDGFFVGLLEGTPITAISAVSYGPAFGFVGFYLCAPGFRGRGFGRRTWDAGLATLGAATVGLDGVVAQQANYRAAGFVLAHRNIRFGGDPPPVQAPAAVRHLTPADLPAVEALDRECFGFQRPAFLRPWLFGRDRSSFGCFSAGCLDGFAVIRACREGAKIGPLFAASAVVASALFDAAASALPGPVFVDVPETNPAAVALAARKGLTRRFETARMYRGPVPPLSIDRIFGITSLELG